jgi:hypothetical protein
MTCIIGVKCEDGIVIISDTKIKAGERATYENKIVPVHGYSNLVIAAAGILDIREKFIHDIENISELLENGILKEDPSRGFVGLVEDIARRLWEIYKPRYAALDCNYEYQALQAFVCQKRTGEIPILHSVNSVGISSKVDSYMVLGTGDQYAHMILKPCYAKEAIMNRIAGIGAFVIRLVDYWKIDESIGTQDGGSVQVWKFPNNSDSYEVEGSELENIMSQAEELLNRFSYFLIAGEVQKDFEERIK